MSKVLIVDDDLDSAEVLRLALERAGYKTVCATNGHAALAAVTATPPDLILLDLRMPVMDGASLLEVLRSYLRWRELPVVVVTAAGQGAEIDRLKDYDVADVFHKASYDLPDLVKRVQQLLPS